MMDVQCQYCVLTISVDGDGGNTGQTDDLWSEFSLDSCCVLLAVQVNTFKSQIS